MKRRSAERYWIIVLALFVLATCVTARASEKTDETAEVKRQEWLKAAMGSIPKEGEDKTLSPYFFVRSDDPKTDQMPLKSTRADINIAGVIADVGITQVYKNEGKNTLEAIYIFPASTRAAVYAMKMTIGDRVIEAEIREREKARAEYEQARKQGKTASLLEQQRPNVFQMNVANILPNDEIKVELKYTELLVPEDNVYEFVYPTVVGPRYSNLPEQGASSTMSWIKNPYLHSGENSSFEFGLDLNLNTGIPIAQLASPSHAINAEYTGKNRAHVTLKESNKAGNRDFVLRYSLAGSSIESGLLLYQGKEENLFLLMMEPPKRVESAQIVPREYIFIIDISGSMHGFPLDVTRKLMRDLFSGLRPSDSFNVLLFAGSNQALSEKSLPATKANIEKAIEVVNRQQGGGGTELIPALRRAMDLPRAKGTSRVVVIATDGYVSVEKDAFELIRRNLGEANLFAFGIGSSVNRHLIEGMARAGMGEPFVVLKEGESAGKAAKFREYIRSPLMTGIKVSFPGFGAYEVEPQSVPDLFAKRPLIIFGKYRGEPAGQIAVTGSQPGKKFQKEIAVTPSLQSPENSALRSLWARERIANLADANRLDKSDARVKEITDLGLKYHLMTEYTSFIAVDKRRRADGKFETVKQPLPMPEGVSDLAVGHGGFVGGAAKMSIAPAPASAARAKRGELLIEEEVAQPPTRKASVIISKVTVTEGADPALTEASIRKAIDLKTMKACYDAQLANDPGIKGEIALTVVVDASGKVISVKVDSATVGNAALRACVENTVKAARFPKRSSTAKAAMTIVLSFEGGKGR